MNTQAGTRYLEISELMGISDELSFLMADKSRKQISNMEAFDRILNNAQFTDYCENYESFFKSVDGSKENEPGADSVGELYRKATTFFKDTMKQALDFKGRLGKVVGEWRDVKGKYME